MINDVTDTNVGKMTFEEAIEIIDISPAYIGLEKISKGCSYDEWSQAVNMAIEALRFQQELVRCKDCANALPWRGDSFYCSVYSYETWKMLVIDDGFCHFGERRDEE